MNGANTTNEYTYDANGNLTKDLNKNITQITYNVLNLPKVVTFGKANTITYTYDGGGNKLSVAYTAGGTTVKTDYVGNKVYKNGTLSMMHTEEGYITFSGATPTYHYYLKDHQGNNRVVMNQSGAVEQVNHYYPFGGLFGEGLQTSNQPYKYNEKELDRFEGLDMYDYGFRFYDPAIARWNAVDPMIEKHFDYSGYAYVYNNPVRFIDVMGLDTIDINYNDDEIWEITNSQIVEGDDVFRITRDGETTTHIFSEGEYGERVNMLNLETNDDYTLGVYHVSGAEWKNGRTGYYVTPGGDASTEVGSGARLPADIYGLQSSPETASWRQIWVTNGKANGNVSARGIKFHFGGSSPADWTQGCFILSSSYTKNGSNIQYSFRESRRATIWMDFHLGANSVYRYATKKYNGSGRIGARFNTTNLTHKLILKDGF